MDLLPLELVERIFAYACTDGGKTGCALSAVNRWIRVESAPMRYHSIALRGGRPIQAFLVLLRNQNTSPATATRTRPRLAKLVLSRPIVHVKHLFLNDFSMDSNEWCGELKYILHKLVRKTRPRKIGEDTSEGDRLRAQAVIHDLLTYLAPTLEHLCLVQKIASTSIFVAIPLPLLVELTCHCRFGAAIETSTHPALREQLLVLKRLHYVRANACEDYAWLNILQYLSPTTSLVRISEVYNPSDLLSWFARPGANPWAQGATFDMIVSCEPYSRGYSNRISGDFSQWRTAKEIVADDFMFSKISVVERENYRYYRNEEDNLYRDWLARVQGGQGCWKEGTPLSLIGL
jgi:hypothetical protein